MKKLLSKIILCATLSLSATCLAADNTTVEACEAMTESARAFHSLAVLLEDNPALYQGAVQESAKQVDSPDIRKLVIAISEMAWAVRASASSAALETLVYDMCLTNLG